MTGPRLLGAVLAGGGSRRFGRDKSQALAGGRRMIERAVDALAPRCVEVVIVSSRDETPRGVGRIVPDLRPGEGPLAGMEAALTEAAALGLDGAFVLAADLPLVDAATVARVADALGPSLAAAAVCDGDPGFEPLCAAYRLECLPVVGGLLDEGRRAARGVFQAVGGRTVAASGSASVNVNTPDDLRRAEAILEGKE